MLRLFLTAATGVLVATLLGSGCAGPGGSGDSGKALRVEFFDYRSNRSLELVSESHTQRLEQYSQVRANANRKVQKDEVMAELVRRLGECSFEQLARPGAAPETPTADVFWSLEVEGPDGTRHALYQRSMITADANACRAMKATFIDVFNQTYALQAVELKDGESPFLAPEPKKKD